MFENFDYRVQCDDFLLYELARLIDEDRASLEDEEFRRVIDEGIHEHIERRLDVRAEMAEELRRKGGASVRILRSIEDIESSVKDTPDIVRSYTSYLFRRLEECADRDDIITPIADRLFDSLDDRAATRIALDQLAGARSAVSARILAYLVSEPMLDEDLENRAYELVRAMWPLPRHYILYSLKPHTHEDIPFRWFQLLVECDEPSAVDRILEEMIVHGGDPNFGEDLAALTELLERSGDPDIDDKIMHALNSEKTPPPAAELLETFLKSAKTHERQHTEGPWLALEDLYSTNKQYLSAAKLYDEGRRADAARKLDELLNENPQYPFALRLKRLT